MKFLLRFASLVLSCLMLVFTANGALAQKSYPDRVVRIIVPYTPGASNDIRARFIAEKLTKSWGQQVIVENKPGADGAIGLEMVAKSAPDGYTIILAPSSALAIHPLIYKTVPFDPIKDFQPITQLGSNRIVVSVPPSSPIKSVKELIASAKSKPGKLNSAYSSADFYLAGEMFKFATGVNITLIPYIGGAPALTALIGKEVQLMFSSEQMVLSHVRAGTVRVIAVCSAKRSPTMPDIPTMMENIPGFETNLWSGLLVPAGTPKEIVSKIHAEVVRILQMPDTKAFFASALIETIVGSTPEEFAGFINAELKRYDKLIKDANIPRL